MMTGYFKIEKTEAKIERDTFDLDKQYKIARSEYELDPSSINSSESSRRNISDFSEENTRSNSD